MTRSRPAERSAAQDACEDSVDADYDYENEAGQRSSPNDANDPAALGDNHRRDAELMPPPTSARKRRVPSPAAVPVSKRAARSRGPFQNIDYEDEDEAADIADSKYTPSVDEEEDDDDDYNPRRGRTSESPLFTPSAKASSRRHLNAPMTSSPLNPRSSLTKNASSSKTTAKGLAPAFLDETTDDGAPIYQTEAHRLKAELAREGLISAASKNGVYTRKQLPEHDPENWKIKEMRQHDHMSWAEIARALNEARIASGKTPSMTEAAVYGRFVRNGPRIAIAQGEVDFNPSDFMHLKPAKEAQPVVPPMVTFPAQHDEYLVQAYREVQEELWANVARRLERKSGHKYSAEACALRFSQL
ncbi:hypothetical protein H2201_008376 [Coniosporium apollinis]|uniref:Myb-like domain-containing protein n=1 Tax=Coniosporium apollinis TaxID=61459 RepID=A0ABQ9NIW3_9PEZI|nr:hypothetical protein H2201_008376 [Coniosporium apollinis]